MIRALAAALVLQGAVAAGSTVQEALDAGVIRDVLGTRFGVVWGLGIAAWALVAALAAAPRLAPVLRPASVGATGLAMPGYGRSVALAVPLAALAALPALGGHASVQSPVALLLPANVVHVLAMAAWFGGVVVLVFALRAATAQWTAATAPASWPRWHHASRHLPGSRSRCCWRQESFRGWSRFERLQISSTPRSGAPC